MAVWTRKALVAKVRSRLSDDFCSCNFFITASEFCIVVGLVGDNVQMYVFIGDDTTYVSLHMVLAKESKGPREHREVQLPSARCGLFLSWRFLLS